MQNGCKLKKPRISRSCRQSETYQYQFVDHAEEEVSLPNIYATDESTLKIPLDKRQTIIQTCSRITNKYDKLKRAIRN